MRYDFLRVLGLALGAGMVLGGLMGCGKSATKGESATPGQAAVAGVPLPSPLLSDNLLDRGAYLVNHVTLCTDCHSTRDWGIEAAPVKPGTEGVGGELFPGPHGKLYSANITPAAIGEWTDEQLYAALTRGVRPDGSALFPIMPWPTYGHLAEADLRAIIAYIRTLKPIASQPPASELVVPAAEVAKMIPAAKERGTRPEPSDTVAYGRYLTNAASCVDCHTQQGPKGPVRELHFAGGMRFELPTGPVVSANITPDKGTGIGEWDEEMFVARFTAYRDRQRLSQLVAGQRNTIMPRHAYAQMTDHDLKAIYAYLKTLPVVAHEVNCYPD